MGHAVDNIESVGLLMTIDLSISGCTGLSLIGFLMTETGDGKPACAVRR